MAITVKHSKTSLIADAGDATLVQPSDWNADHTLTGTIPVANGGTGASTLTGYVKGSGTANMTAASTIPNTDITGLGTASTKDAGSALGVATLDAGGTVPLSQIPASIQGGVSYQGTWNASTNTPTLSNSVGTKGYYYVVSVAGSTNLDGITAWNVGDWAIFNGTVWQKVDNTDAVTSVNGYTGTVVLTNTDISGFGTMSTQNANSVAITGGTINGTTIGATTASTGAFTTATASTSFSSPVFKAVNSAGGALQNAGGTNQIQWGGGGGNNVSIDVSTNLNGTNAQIDISPTGTGHVHMKPTGSGSIEIAPTNAGTMNNMVIGGTTPLAITGTTITATSFVGSGASLTNVVNSLAASTGISVSGSTGAVTVTNTAPDQTVALASGTGISVTGTYPNFTVTNTAPSSGGTVTSVTGTAPVVSSGGNTPAISMAAATGSVNGYLTSTDWTTFNNKGSGTVTAVSVVSANGFTGTSSGGATPALTLTTSITGMLKGNGAAISAGTAGTDFVAPATATSFTAQQYFGNVALTDAATIAWAANTAQVATFTFVSSNRTMGAPTGLVSGAYYGLAVIQNSGSNTLTWNSVFKWAGGTAPTLSTAASAKDYFVFRTDGTNLYEQGRSLGVA